MAISLTEDEIRLLKQLEAVGGMAAPGERLTPMPRSLASTTLYSNSRNVQRARPFGERR